MRKTEIFGKLIKPRNPQTDTWNCGPERSQKSIFHFIPPPPQTPPQTTAYPPSTSAVHHCGSRGDRFINSHTLPGAERSRCNSLGGWVGKRPPGWRLMLDIWVMLAAAFVFAVRPGDSCQGGGGFFDRLAAAAGWFMATLRVERRPLEGGWVERENSDVSNWPPGLTPSQSGPAHATLIILILVRTFRAYPRIRRHLCHHGRLS